MGFTEDLIAPCGINCGTCIAYLREKNKCCGCLVTGTNKAAHCSQCILKNCEEHAGSEFTYCFECSKFPCLRLKKLNKRYVERYCLNVIDNLIYIKNNGIDEFLKREDIKWECGNCGKVLSVHKNYCLGCKTEYR